MSLTNMIPKQDITLISQKTIVTNIMTLESNKTVEISTSDIESRNDRIINELIEAGGVATTQKTRIITLVKEWTYNLEQLVDSCKVPWGKETVYGTILTNLHKKGMTAAGMVHVYEVFKNPDFNRFRVIKQLPASSPPPLSSLLLQQKAHLKKFYEAEKAADDTQINDAIQILESNFENERVKEYRQRNFATYEKETRKNKQLQKDLEKICMEHPESKISSFSEALKRLSQIADIAAQRVETYPPLNEQDDQYYTQGVLLYTKWIQSIADLKHSRSNYSWIDIQIEKNTQSTHSAMSKSKIEAMFKSKKFEHLKGTLRKVTREQIDAKEPEIIKLAVELIRLAPEMTGDETWLMVKDIFYELIEQNHPLTLTIASEIIKRLGPVLFGLDHYKDKYQAPWNGGFHVRRHDKLSESAFGNSTTIPN